MISSVSLNTYITNCLLEILNGVYGRDVRQAIHDAIQWTCDSMVTLKSEVEAWTAGMEEWKENLQAEWNFAHDDLYQLLDHLCYVNDKTGDVVLTGADIKLNYSNPDSKTLSQCMLGTGSNIETQFIQGSSEDYKIVVTLGGLV